MSERFRKADFVPPEARDLHRFKGATLKEVIDYLEGEEKLVETLVEEPKPEEVRHLFDGFLDLLHQKGIRVSTPEWLQFLRVLTKKARSDELKRMVASRDLMHKVRLFAQTTLVKNKANEAAFHEAFDEYFLLAAKVFQEELKAEQPEKSGTQESSSDQEDETRDSEQRPDIKEQLGIKEVDENLETPEDEEHQDDETVHGGKKDQHNDILKKADISKQGGGNKKKEASSGEGDKGEAGSGKGDKGDAGEGEGDKGDKGAGKGDKGETGQGGGDQGEAGQGMGDKGEAGKGMGDKGQPSGMGKGGSKEKGERKNGQPAPSKDQAQGVQQELTQEGLLIGGGKGKSITAHRVNEQNPIHAGRPMSDEDVTERRKTVGRVDRRTRYETRPDRASMREVIRNIRRIILDVSETKSRNVDLKRTVGNFARGNFAFEYQREREKQPEIVLLIDVGGPVDEWSPLVKEVVEAMSADLSKLEVYLFHNNLYGYVWKPDPKDMLASSYAKPNSLIDIKAIVKKRKKVIIYGDAEMSYSEFGGDGWPPANNEERIRRFGMSGPDCLEYIKRKAERAVWINPVFKKEWQERDDSGTIHAAESIIPMHDLTVGGVEDAVKELMKK